MGYNLILMQLISLLILTQFGHWEYFQVGSCVVSTLPPSFFFFSSALLSDTTRCSKFTHIFPVPALTSAISPSSSWFLLFENGTQKPRSGHQVWILVLECHCFRASSAHRAGKYMYVYEHMHHTSAFIVISIHLYFIKSHEFILIPTIPIQYHEVVTAIILTLLFFFYFFVSCCLCFFSFHSFQCSEFTSYIVQYKCPIESVSDHPIWDIPTGLRSYAWLSVPWFIQLWQEQQACNSKPDNFCTRKQSGHLTERRQGDRLDSQISRNLSITSQDSWLDLLGDVGPLLYFHSTLGNTRLACITSSVSVFVTRMQAPGGQIPIVQLTVLFLEPGTVPAPDACSWYLVGWVGPVASTDLHSGSQDRTVSFVH